MNESKPMQTGVPSADRPWMQYYPPQLIENLAIPEQTIGEYLRAHCPGDDVVAMHYYGKTSHGSSCLSRLMRLHAV